MKNKYLSTSLGLYMNYFVHGMALIIIAQNIDFLSQKWHTDLAGAAGVVSSFGIGKLLAVFIWEDYPINWVESCLLFSACFSILSF